MTERPNRSSLPWALLIAAQGTLSVLLITLALIVAMDRAHPLAVSIVFAFGGAVQVYCLIFNLALPHD